MCGDIKLRLYIRCIKYLEDYISVEMEMEMGMEKENISY